MFMGNNFNNWMIHRVSNLFYIVECVTTGRTLLNIWFPYQISHGFEGIEFLGPRSGVVLNILRNLIDLI